MSFSSTVPHNPLNTKETVVESGEEKHPTLDLGETWGSGANAGLGLVRFGLSKTTLSHHSPKFIGDIGGGGSGGGDLT